jgi:Uri superfamily endonuclease
MEFKMVEFDCKFKMQVKIDEGMSEEEIIGKIEENFEFVQEYGSSSCDDADDYSAYMTFDDVKNLKIVE